MSGKQPAAKRQGTTVVLGGEEKGELQHLCGSPSDRFNNILLNALGNTLWAPAGQSEEDRTAQCTAAVIALGAFKPADEIEGMLAAQAIAMHHASMECSRRAMVPEQPFEIAQGFRKAAANASRTFTELLSALDRRRGKGGQQRVTVEHVHVHSGGQAIVGAVASNAAGGGGAEGKMGGEPHASRPELAHAPEPGVVLSPVREQDANRDSVSVSGDAEWPLPDAWRAEHRATNGCGN